MSWHDRDPAPADLSVLDLLILVVWSALTVAAIGGGMWGLLRLAEPLLFGGAR